MVDFVIIGQFEQMKPGQPVGQWHRICNMRTTLLQLQYLHSALSEQLQDQSDMTSRVQRDRLLQLQELHKQTHELRASNFKTLLIAKLESLLSVYVPVEDVLWDKLHRFVACVRYLEDEMARDVCKLYVGQGMMLDVPKCQAQLKAIEDRLLLYLQENASTFEDYNKGIEDIKAVEQGWQGFLQEMKAGIQERIQPHYVSYIRRRLASKQKELAQSIRILEQFIKS